MTVRLASYFRGDTSGMGSLEKLTNCRLTILEAKALLAMPVSPRSRLVIWVNDANGAGRGQVIKIDDQIIQTGQTGERGRRWKWSYRRS